MVISKPVCMKAMCVRLSRMDWRQILGAMVIVMSTPAVAHGRASSPPEKGIVDYPDEVVTSDDEVVVHLYDVGDIIDRMIQERRTLDRPELLSAPSRGESRYEVAKGDTLALIAERLLVSDSCWDLLAAHNGILEGDVLHVGQTLRIPAWPRTMAPDVADRAARDEKSAQFSGRLISHLASRREADSPVGAPDVKRLNSNLIVRTSLREHEEISEFLSDLRFWSSMQVGIDISFLMGIDEELAGQGVKVVPPRGGGESGGVAILTPEQVEHILGWTAGNRRSVCLATPIVHVFNGECASVQIASTSVDPIPDAQRPGKTVDVEIAEGVSVNLRAVVSDDCGSVMLKLHFGMADVDRSDRVLIEWRAEAASNVTLSDGGAAIIELAYVPFALVSADAAVDPETGESRTVVARRLAEAPVRKVYVLVRPKVIIQQESESVLYPGLEDSLKYP